MTLATLVMDLLVSGCATTREKRRRLRAIVAKLHQHFNVSVAEMDYDGDLRRVRLAVAAIGKSRREVRETLERVADAVAAHPRAELLSQVITEV